MTTFRTEGQLVGAANGSRALTSLVCAYLDLWEKHANGCYGVFVPREKFTVVFSAPSEKGICFTLVYTKTHMREVPHYYDVDDDNFVEGFGADNTAGYTIETSQSINEKSLVIPYKALLMSSEDMEKEIIAGAARYKKAEAEKEHQRKIKEAEDRLHELRERTV